MQVFSINGRIVKMWASKCDAHAWLEVSNLCRLPYIFKHLALMPDVHGGKGMPIGTVLAANGVVVPNAVGVDIGCGMCAVKTDVPVASISSDVLRKVIMSAIREQIPVGMKHHEQMQDEDLMPTGFDIDSLEVVKREYASARTQVGTLGGGNHFIELQRDEEGLLWVMIHSGSRNLGKKVADFYNSRAVQLNALWHSKVTKEMQMAFLPKETPEFDAYWQEMQYCVEFGFANRKLMMQRIKAILVDALGDVKFEPMINIAHNYASWEHHFGSNVIVHRKGATRARRGEVGIIPGSQGSCSFIVEGLGNEESYMSCSHGAGRAMSRSEAVRTLNLEEEAAKLDALGIVHAIRTEQDLEEAASAYKDINEVIAQQTDLVAVTHKLLPVAVVKG